MKMTKQNLDEALQNSSPEKLADIFYKAGEISRAENLVIGEDPVSVLPVPLIMDRKPVDRALESLDRFMEALIQLEIHLISNPGGNLYGRLMDSLTDGGRHLVGQCSFEDENSIRRRLRRVDGYLDPLTGGYRIIEVNQAAPLALHFYDTSQMIVSMALRELGFDYPPALISPKILEWFTGEFSRRNNGELPKTIALVIEHGYPPKFTDLPGMARRVEKLAMELYGHRLEIVTCFPYEISLKENRIMLGSRQVDMIWRNSVYMTEYRRKGLPIEDYENILSRQDEFVVVNSTRSWLTRTKEVFALLWDDGACAEAGFTSEETAAFRQVIPYSLNLSLCPDRISEVVGEKDSWILKPTDSGFGKGVEFGSAHSPLQWEALVKEKAVPGFVFQKRVEYTTAEIRTFGRDGRLMAGMVEHDFCPHHINGSFPGTALVRANPVNCPDPLRGVTMNLCSGGSLMPLVVI